MSGACCWWTTSRRCWLWRQTILRKAGFLVSEASNGGDALALFTAGERFDAIITDYMMPGVSGVQLIQQARLIQPDLVTGFAEVAEFDPARHNAVLVHKPFKRDALIAQIRALVMSGGRRAPTGGGEAYAAPLGLSRA
ncbi:MAG: response regulator [Acetobacteraceae bacterium]